MSRINQMQKWSENVEWYTIIIYPQVQVNTLGENTASDMDEPLEGCCVICCLLVSE